MCKFIHQPKVSIIVPTYNRIEYIQETIDSLLEQSYLNKEIICVDDGSDDGTWGFLCHIQNSNQGIKILRIPHCGSANAKNEGLKAATGDYILFVDSDDLLSLKAIEIMVDRAVSTQADIVFCRKTYFTGTIEKNLYSKGEGLVRCYIPERKFFSPDDIKDFIFNFTEFSPTAKLIRRDLIVNNKLTFPDFPRSEDFPFISLAICLSQRLSVIYKSLYFHRYHEHSLEANKDKFPISFIHATKFLELQLKTKGYFNKYEQSFFNALIERSWYNLKTSSTPSAIDSIKDSLKELFDYYNLTAKPRDYFYNKVALSSVSSALEVVFSEPESYYKKISHEDVTLSVIIPFFNAAQYIEKCLYSVLNCSLSDIEVICIDNNSTDGTYKIIERIGSKDRRIRLIKNPIGFAGASRNVGLSVAKGRFIHFLDADDWVNIDSYATLCRKMEDFQLDFVAFPNQAVSSNTLEKVNCNYFDLTDLSDEKFDRIISYPLHIQLLLNLNNAPWAKIYNRQFLLRNKIYFADLMCSNDVSFHISAVINCTRGMLCRIFCVNYRVNIDSSLIGIRAKHFKDVLDSSDIVSSIASKLPQDIRDIIISSDYNNYHTWYNRFKGNNNFLLRFKEMASNLPTSNSLRKKLSKPVSSDISENTKTLSELREVQDNHYQHIKDKISKLKRRTNYKLFFMLFFVITINILSFLL